MEQIRQIHLNFFDIILPVIGSITTLLAYGIILYKRYEKQNLITKDYNEDKREEIDDKLSDNSEFLWWMMVSVVIFMAFFGFLLIFVARYHILSFGDVLMYGIAVWGFIAWVGFRITKPKK